MVPLRANDFGKPKARTSYEWRQYHNQKNQTKLTGRKNIFQAISALLTAWQLDTRSLSSEA